MAITSLTLVNQTADLHPVAQNFAGLYLPATASEEAITDFLIKTDEYTEAVTIDKAPYLSAINPVTEELIINPVQLHGMMLFGKQMFDAETGLSSPKISVVMKVCKPEKPVAYISFTTGSPNAPVVRFFQKVCPALRPVGNFDQIDQETGEIVKRPLLISIRQFPVAVGSMFNVSLIK